MRIWLVSLGRREGGGREKGQVERRREKGKKGGRGGGREEGREGGSREKGREGGGYTCTCTLKLSVH